MLFSSASFVPIVRRMSRPTILPAYILATLPLVMALLATAVSIGTGDEVVNFFRQYRQAHPALTACMQVITDFGNPLLYLVYGAIFFRARMRGDRHDMRFVAVYIVVQLLVSFLAVRILKIGFGMPRPGTEGPAIPFSFKGVYNSFPSGHTTEIVGAVVPLAWRCKALLPTLALGIYMGIVGYSRIYLGMHHITDVFAGLLLGSVAAWIIHRLADRTPS